MKKFWNWIHDDSGGRVLRLEGPIDEDDFWELPEDKRQAAADAENNNPIERIILKKCPEYGPARYAV